MKTVVKLPLIPVAGAGDGKTRRLLMVKSDKVVKLGKLTPVTVTRVPGGPEAGLMLMDLAGTECLVVALQENVLLVAVMLLLEDIDVRMGTANVVSKAPEAFGVTVATTVPA